MLEKNRKDVNICCVCLCKSVNLIHLTSSRNNEQETESWLKKLEKCVAEIEWYDDDYLCQPCSNQLDFVYNFRQLCLKSNETRQNKAYSSEEIKSESHVETSNKSNSAVYVNPSVYLIKPQLLDENNVFTCADCNTSFDRKSELEVHCKDSHKEDNCFNNEIVEDSTSITTSDESNLDVSDLDLNTCNTKSANICRKKRVSWIKNLQPKAIVIEHSQTRGSKTEYVDLKCCICETVFEDVTKLFKHSVTEHNMEKKEIKPYACPKCPWRFRLPYSLRDHIKYHDNIRNEVCSYCGKGFVTKAALATHEKQHLNLREYQCPHCPKSFNTHKDIRTHKYVVHTDPSKWKHVCPVCSKRFPVKSNFDAHVRRHNNEKPYGCHLCDAKFCVTSSLRIHVQSHSNVREHKCLECGNEYKNFKYLQQHMNKKHNIGNVKIPDKVKKFICCMCPKRFDAKNKLTRHLCTHTGERPFACSICNKRFTDKSYVTQHMKTVHNYIPDNDR